LQHRRSTLESWTAIAAEAEEIIRRRSHDQALRIGEIAHALNVSRRKVQRALAAAGTDFTAELHRVRMETAARTLAHRYYVRVVHRRSGLKSPSHFSRAFRRYFGVTPQQFRRAARLNGRLQWRAWKDQIEPVKPGTPEYFRRRKRWSEDERALHRLVREMLPAGRAALHANAPPERPVIDLEALRARSEEMRRERTRVRRFAFDMAYEQYVAPPEPRFVDLDFDELPQ
jgi:AraC-like DNA-binding protein